MASATTERTPLVAPTGVAAPVRRTVTFTPDTRLGTSPGDAATRPGPRGSAASGQHPTPSSSSSGLAAAPPMLSSLNSKLRRRNSHGATGTPSAALSGPVSKIGPQRTTKKAQKLKLLPNPEHGDDGPDEESGRDVYSQFTRIKDPSARRDAARLGKADRDKLPRVTAYCTASSYRMEGLLRFLKGRGKTKGALPKRFDECIYTPYDYGRSKPPGPGAGMAAQEADTMGSGLLIPPSSRDALLSRRQSDSALVVGSVGEGRSPGLDGLEESMSGRHLEQEANNHNRHQPNDGTISNDMRGDGVGSIHGGAGTSLSLISGEAVDLDTQVHTPEVFLFEYGTVVIWGMTLQQEERFLKELAKFETEKLSADDVQTENFNFYYTSEYQARIYNDFISLRDKRNYMTKLAISHALAQSVKTSLYEDLLSTTIEETTPFPNLLATTGSISLSRREINQKIGELFILRINIHLQGSVLDSPELMWAEPQLEPVYIAVRSYLEMDQRVTLMNERLNVLGDLLAVLKDQVGTKHGEYLEWIVIVLIAAEILVAAINIVVDLYAGVD